MIQYYPLPTIADMATRLHRAKVIIKLDARNGFWHVTLDDESSFLTTFNTTFGRYCWKRMPFGIKSATEIFQCKMHEVTEGLVQVEVDEFLVVGCGITVEEGTCDHDQKRPETFAMVLKPLHAAPQHLQRMLLHLQKFNL